VFQPALAEKPFAVKVFEIQVVYDQQLRFFADRWLYLGRDDMLPVHRNYRNIVTT
jgi:hypothetical protein